MTDERTTHEPRVILVTGGAGFIGCNLVRYLLGVHEHLTVVNLDLLTYAGSRSNLAGLEGYGGRHIFVEGDIRQSNLMGRLLKEYAVDTIVHLAAESHVDRSIDSPESFATTNIMGTYCLLEAARKEWAGRTDVRFHHVSTDEVFGSLSEEGMFSESTRYDPSSPYSASKAASDHLVRAWQRTFGLPVTVTNCSNNYGPYQFPEKLIPLMITSALAGKPMPVYGDGSNVRDWLYVEDHCRALDMVVRRGEVGRTYMVGGTSELSNVELVRRLGDILMELAPLPKGHYRDQIQFVTDRPGHDHRYAMDTSRIRKELGWTPRVELEQGLRRTIEWYLHNGRWVEAVLRDTYSGERLGLQG